MEIDPKIYAHKEWHENFNFKCAPYKCNNTEENSEENSVNEEEREKFFATMEPVIEVLCKRLADSLKAHNFNEIICSDELARCADRKYYKKGIKEFDGIKILWRLVNFSSFFNNFDLHLACVAEVHAEHYINIKGKIIRLTEPYSVYKSKVDNK